MTDPLFTLDGESYGVDVLSLQREFAVAEADGACLTMDGTHRRQPLGTYYHYTITVRCRQGNEAELERFWQTISRPAESIECCFPYGDSRLTQRMYVQSGSQALLDSVGGNRWGTVTVRFLGTLPQVLS